MGMETLAAIGLACTAILAILALVKFIVNPIRRMLRIFEDFREDWAGEPARPGVPARAGVLERLASIEHELKTNGGSSLKDAVVRVEKQSVEIRSDVDEVKKLVIDQNNNA